LETSDDNSEVTTPAGIETTKIEHQMVTKKLKLSFVNHSKQHQTPQQAHPGAIHTHWLHAIQSALGDNIIIWNNKGEEVGPLNLIQWTSNPTIHQKQFNVHQKITGGNGPRRNNPILYCHLRIHLNHQEHPRNPPNSQRQLMLPPQTPLEQR
jgi:hypothetical protein